MNGRLGSLLLLAVMLLSVSPAMAAERPTFIIAFVPMLWRGGLDSFEAEAWRQGAFFVSESGIDAYANVEIIVLRDRLDDVSLSDPLLAYQVVVFGLVRQPADRYIGLTNGDLAPFGEKSVVGWTHGPDSLGTVLEAGFVEVTAHELGHTFGLCDEYSYQEWHRQDSAWSCPNPYPTHCPRVDGYICQGLPALNGHHSIMGPAGMPGDYAYNEPSLAHLQTVFATMFGNTAPPLYEPEPIAPPQPVAQAIAFAGADLMYLEPGKKAIPIAPGPAYHLSWSLDGAWLAFAATYNGNLDLYRLPAGGGPRERLTRSPARESHPAWLPGSTRLIYVSDASGIPALYLLDLSHDTSRQLVELPLPASWPAVSKDGTWLTFSAAPDGNWSLYRVALDVEGLPVAGTLVRLTQSAGFDIAPAWHPDGHQVAFASNRGGSLDLYILVLEEANVTAVTRTTGNAWAPSWLADGRMVYQLFEGGHLSIQVVSPVNGRSLLISNDGETAAWPAAQP
jgi:hypothetical protein